MLFLLTDVVVDIVWREKDEGSFSVCVVLSFGTWRGGGEWRGGVAYIYERDTLQGTDSLRAR